MTCVFVPQHLPFRGVLHGVGFAKTDSTRLGPVPIETYLCKYVQYSMYTFVINSDHFVDIKSEFFC